MRKYFFLFSYLYKREVMQKKNRDQDQGKVYFYIDHTKRRFELRKITVEYVKDKPDVEFVFADINCNLSIFFKNAQYVIF